MHLFFIHSFSSRLKELRTSKGLTMVQLANDIDSTRATISNLKMNKENPV